jgi:hypothetical protein
MTHLYKRDSGNLLCKELYDAETEARLRAEGFQSLAELFPHPLPSAADLDAVAAEQKVKTSTKGRKA